MKYRVIGCGGVTPLLYPPGCGCLGRLVGVAQYSLRLEVVGCRANHGLWWYDNPFPYSTDELFFYCEGGDCWAVTKRDPSEQTVMTKLYARRPANDH